MLGTDPYVSTVLLASMCLPTREHQQRLRREADVERLAHGGDTAERRAKRAVSTPTPSSARRLLAWAWNRS